MAGAGAKLDTAGAAGALATGADEPSLLQLPSPHDWPPEVELCTCGAAAATAGAGANDATAGAAGARATGADEPSLLQLPSPHDWPPEVEL